MSATVSLCLIARDEALNIPRCLKSIQGLVDEIILIDTGSTDNTPEIAVSFGAQVHHVPWSNDFSTARNASISFASKDWILVMDADEELEVKSRQKLHSFINNTKFNGYSLTIRNLQPTGELIPWIDISIVRMFRRLPEIQFEGTIHEQISPSILRSGGTIGKSDLILLHYGYQQKDAQGRSRAQRNKNLIEKALELSPDDPYLLYQLGVTLKALNKLEEARIILEKSILQLNYLPSETQANIWLKLAQIYLSQENYSYAHQNAMQCLHLEPNNLLALYTAALALYSQGKLHEAYPLFKKISIQPGISSQEKANLQLVINSIQSTIK